MSILTKEIIELINHPGSIKIIATSDENGNPHTAFKGCLTVLEDGNIAFAEAFEGSQTNINLTRSIWFNKNVEITIRSEEGQIIQITGRPYKYVYTGELFLKFYRAVRNKRGPDSELAGVWIITPDIIKDESYSVVQKEEDEKHPFFRHLDRISVRPINKN